MATTEDLFQRALSFLSIGGIKATPKGSLSLPVAYSCIKVISETVGMLPMHHYRKTNNGREQVYTNLTNLVSVRPHPYLTSSDFYATWVSNALLMGNGYALINRNDNGIVQSLTPVPSEYVKPKIQPDGKLLYQVSYEEFERDQVKMIEPENILHLKGLGFDAIQGKSPIEYAAEAYGFALSTQKYGHEFFKNGAHLKGFIEMPPGVQIDGRTKEEKRSTWDRIKKGVLGGLTGETSAGQVGLLENGMKFTAVGLPNDQAQFLESRKFSREEIAAMFRVPGYMVGEMTNAIKSNIEQQSIEFIQYAVMPWLVKMEQEIKYKLLPGKVDEYFKFNVNSYLRGTALERAQYYKEMRYAGLITEQEARMLEDLPKEPREGQLLIAKNIWGPEEYQLELEKRRKELNATA